MLNGVVVRKSHGLDIVAFNSIEGLYVRCDVCSRYVLVNGPGSDKNIFQTGVRKFLWLIAAREQELFTPAADLHDLSCHKGLSDGELVASNKLYRKHCYEAINAFYSPKMKALSTMLRNRKRPGFFESLFDGDKRKLRAKWSELDTLVSERKRSEEWAERHYTALRLGSRDVVPKTPCTMRQHDRDLL